jgi:hypothetical protein
VYVPETYFTPKLIAVQLPEDARHLAIQQLQALTGVAKGLTRVSDSLLTIDDSAEALEETERLKGARGDARMTDLRSLLMQAITSTVELWSTDASVGDVGLLSLLHNHSLTILRLSANLLRR